MGRLAMETDVAEVRALLKTMLALFNALSIMILLQHPVCLGQSQRVITFQTNNSDPAQFGYECRENGGPGVGPCSIAVNGEVAFVVDNYHDNIKKLDLASGSIQTTNRSTSAEHKRWFRDVTVLHDKVIVSSDLDFLYVYDVDLRLLDSLYVKRGASYFRWLDDSLTLCSPFDGTTYRVFVREGKVTVETSGASFYEMSQFVTTAHGRNYRMINRDDSWRLQSRNSTFKLLRKIHTVECYDAINIDISGESLVYFEIGPKGLRFYLSLQDDCDR